MAQCFRWRVNSAQVEIAAPLGLELIELERKLNNHLANGTITEKLLNELPGRLLVPTGNCAILISRFIWRHLLLLPLNRVPYTTN